ncbi:MAG: alpha/beta hydrolase [Pleurocapsa minor GSE-CHR-MK-17-07R]|jgi:pimeloyl-ACP methyl ester carboxylesterase|nr:alpha/beta hydrolase [Pleurocapsa minor GSE-CHR-MK 17-07R]
MTAPEISRDAQHKRIVALDDVPLMHHTIESDSVRLHVVEAGDPANPLVVLLHGFPEFWYGWRNQIPALVRAGYHVLVPDQRGYNLSDKPAGLEPYNLNHLAGDVVALIDWAGQEQAYVVGHDWGAAVAWWTAATFGNRVKKLGILNVPHVQVMLDDIRANPAQMMKSWYIGFFQIPYLPDLLLTLGEAQGAATMLLRTSNPGSFSDEDLGFYIAAWKQPGAMTAMLNWYRSMVQLPPSRLTNPTVTMPVLIQWGKNDVALTPELAEKSLKFCTNGRVIYYPDATHWVQHDKPDEVNARLIEFLGE